MHIRLLGLLAAGLLLLPALGRGQIHFTATLTGAQAVPPVTTTASGSGSFTLSDDFTELRYVISYQGLSGQLSAAGGHFHLGLPGQNGAVAKTIASGGAPSSGTFSGVWKSSDDQPLTAALVESLLTGRLYVNLHTSANPANEIRGQVNLATALHFEANLTGDQEPTPVVTGAGGTGVFVLSPDGSQLDYYVVYRALSGALTAGGHIHVGAPGVSGAVVKAIASTGGPASGRVKGSWKSTDGTSPLTPALVDSLVAGHTYVNFHTSSNPAGEIRGQITLAGGTGYVAWMEGNNEPTPVVGDGVGVGSFVLNSAMTELTYAVTYTGLTGPLTAGGHLHLADPGRSGPVVKTIASGGGPASATIAGVWRSTDGEPLTRSLAESLLTGRIYVNFHTANNPAGEIRDQVRLTTGVGFTVELDGTQETPSVITAGRGSGSVVLNAERSDVRYSITYFDLSGPLSAGGHFHQGAPGFSGPVLHAIAPGAAPAAATFDGNWNPASRSEIDALVAGNVYANFHTSAHPGGEIRGQVLLRPEATTSAGPVTGTVPARFTLEQNYPNPFNPSTVIGFQLPVASHVTLRVFNLLGQEVATVLDAPREAGAHEVSFNAAGLASGLYFYRLSTEAGTVGTKQMVVLK